MVGTIGALTRNHCKYITCPFLISGTCKSKDAHAHMDLLSIVWRTWNQMRGTIKGEVYCIASDSESRHGKALVTLTEHTPLSQASPLFAYLGSLPLLNLMVVKDELTSDRDYKHVMKKFWNVHVRPSSISIGRVQITSAWQSHL